MLHFVFFGIIVVAVVAIICCILFSLYYCYCCCFVVIVSYLFDFSLSFALQMSSAAGKIPAPGRAVYSASKFALNCYFHSLRSEVQRKLLSLLSLEFNLH